MKCRNCGQKLSKGDAFCGNCGTPVPARSSRKVLYIAIGLIVILIAAPLRRRKRIPDGARKIYKWREESGSVEEAYRRKVKAQIEDKKRKWRY